MTDTALPPFAEWVAPASWQVVDFLSDVHLHPDHPRTFAAWRDHLLNTPADAVLMLGDLFEVWVGDDAIDGRFEQSCVAVLTQAAGRKALGFMPGNRDFLVGAPLMAQAGLQALADPTVLRAFGQRLLLTHGDALCLADTDYQQFRRQVRSAPWQRDFLARPLDERRSLARAMRDASAAHQATVGPAGWADADPAEAVRWLQAAGTTTLLHGHTHRPGSDHPAPGFDRHVLSDWEFDAGAPRADVLRLSASGLQRVAPAQA